MSIVDVVRSRCFPISDSVWVEPVAFQVASTSQRARSYQRVRHHARQPLRMAIPCVDRAALVAVNARACRR